VLDYLAPKRILLILDNCEHLLDALARQVDAITQRCAEVSVLATSREGLALPCWSAIMTRVSARNGLTVVWLVSQMS
jgi:hypothetical protein